MSLKDGDKNFGKTQHPFIIKTSKLGIERSFLSMIQSTCQDPVLTASYSMMFPAQIGNKARMSPPTVPFNIGREVLGKAVRREKEIKVYRFGREK